VLLSTHNLEKSFVWQKHVRVLLEASVLFVCLLSPLQRIGMAEEKGQKVVLHVYDISMGMAKMYAQMFIGKSLEGIWFSNSKTQTLKITENLARHTGVVVFGKEFYWGGEIQEDSPVQFFV
jgi:hypothetical protein